jgi:hypothetical protein
MPLWVLKDFEFHRWAEGEGLTDAKLRQAALEIENGLVNARLGGFLVKKRVRAAGRGKRGGYRTIVAHRQGDRLVFLHGFDKNEKDNISSREQEAPASSATTTWRYATPICPRWRGTGLS